MIRFFVDVDIAENQRVLITGEDAQHLRVLRVRTGEELEIVGKQAIAWRAVVVGLANNSVDLNIQEQIKNRNELHIRVVLFQSLLKSDKMDFVVQKAVELGVSEVVPVLTQRSIATGDRAMRWRRIAKHAAMQSRRDVIPHVCEVLGFEEALGYAEGLGCVLAAHEDAHRQRLSFCASRALEKGIGSIGIFVGPEGGLSPAEICVMEDRGIICANLGPRILRAETAAIVVLSAILLSAGEV